MTVAVGRVRLQRWLELSRSESRVDRSEILGSRANQQRLLNQLVLFELIGFLHFFLSRFSLSLIPPVSFTMSEPEHIRATYNDIHKLIRASAERIAEFKPDLLIAIGETSRG